MAPKHGATVKTIRSLLTRIGSATSGNKNDLVSRLSRDLSVPSRMPTTTDATKATRILSIDMGIKNLAFCVADVTFGSAAPRASGRHEQASGIQMHIQAWRRLDVAQEVSRPDGQQNAGEEDDDDDGPYSSPTLSKSAYTLLSKTFLPYKPDIILIERQRWRSAGGIAIQQWTVRVNTLEGMLWAILTALRAESPKQKYDIFSVDPKRVGGFWIDEDVRAEMPKSKKSKQALVDELSLGPDGEVQDVLGDGLGDGRKLSRGKVEKKAKIGLLRSWLSSKTSSTSTSVDQVDHLGLSTPDIQFRFSPDAEVTKQALCTTTKAKGSKKTKEVAALDLRKLDDVTDCFLQAAAWVAWEAYREKAGQQVAGEGCQLHELLGKEPPAQDDGSGEKKAKAVAMRGSPRSRKARKAPGRSAG